MDISAAGVFVAGVLTFLSPCVLPVIPIYLSILEGGGDGSRPSSRFRSVLSTVAFSAGFALVFSLLGLSATSLGRFLAQNRALFQQVAGLVVLLLGLRFMGYLKLPLPGGSGAGMTSRFKTRFHYVNAFVLGLLFAVAWTPCVGSVLGAVLTYTSLATSDPLEGMAYLGLYSLGFAMPLLLVALIAGPALAALKKARRFLPVFEKVTGLLLVLTGFLLVTDQWSIIDNAFERAPETAIESTTASPDPVHVWHPSGSAENTTCGSGGSTTCGVGSEEALPTMYKFYSPTCPICLQMVPIVNVLRNQCLGKGLQFVDVDVTRPAGKSLARKYRVTGIPVFVFEDADGNEVSRLVGFQKLDNLEQAASVLTGEECSGFKKLDGLQPQSSHQ
ncbi:MAG: thioredoxin fold domain-containing protein [Deltaproteobacteria bacterium]|nr:thioredoxin fold domain-containing protein [Deltaproteobacteria bacterium]